MESVSPPAVEAALAHTGFVRGLARALLGADPAVDDVVQETWLAAARGGPRDPARMKGWLGGIVRRLSAGVIRKRATERRHHPHLPQRGDAPSTEDVVAREEMRREVVEAMLALREPYRSVLLLRYYEDLPPREVAGRLGVPVETARTRTKRGLALLRAELDDRRGGRAGWAPLVGVLAGLAPAPTGAAGVGLGMVAACLLVLAALGALVRWGLLDDDDPAAPSHMADSEDAPEMPRKGPSGATLVGRARPVPAAQAANVPAGRARIEGFVRRGGAPLAGDVELRFAAALPTDFAGRMRAAERYEGRARTQAAGRTTRSDARGRFAFDGLGLGTYVVSVAGPDGVAYTRLVYVPADGLAVDGSLGLPAGDEQLTVLARRGDGTPYVGPVHLALRDAEKGSPVRANVATATDAAGRLAVAGLPAGRVFFQVREPGLRMWRHILLPQRAPLEITIGSTGHVLRGRVSAKAGGTAVAGASVAVRVSLGSRRLGSDWSERREVATDTEGRFEIAFGKGRGDINVSVDADGYMRWHTEWDRSDAPLAIELYPETVIAGRVVSRAGDGIAGAQVVVVQIDGRYVSTHGRTRTDARGRFALRSLRPGRYSLFARAPGWASPRLGEARAGAFNPFVLEVEGTGPRDVELVVEPVKPVVGRVVDASGAPVPGACVQAAHEDGFGRDSPRALIRRSEIVSSDADGRFVLRDVVPGLDWHVEAKGPAILPVTTPTLALGSDAPPLVVRAVRVDPARDLVVRVLDDERGLPIEGVGVRVVQLLNDGWSSLRRLHAATDADGVARLTPVPTSGVGVMLDGPEVDDDRRPRALPTGDEQSLAMTIRVPRRYSISGTLEVTPDGLPDHAWVRVAAHREGARRPDTDAVRGHCDEDSGRWTVGPLTKGRWTVVVEVQHRERAQGTFEAGTRDAKLRFEWRWKRPREAPAPEPETTEIRYLLVGPDGAKVPRATYSEWMDGMSSGGAVRDGRRTLRYGTGLPKHVVEVFGARDAAGGRLPYGAIVLAPDALRSGDVTLRMQAEKTISGRVLVGGKPARAGARVRASVVVAVDGEDLISENAHGEASTDADGRFRLAGLGPYRYALVVTGAGGLGHPAPDIVAAGTQDVVLELRAAAAPTVVVVDEAGKPLPGIPIRVFEDKGRRRDRFRRPEARQTDAQGRIMFKGLDPDVRYTLEVLARPSRHGVFGLRRERWVPEDETLRLQAAYSVSGTVRAPDGVPVANASLEGTSDGTRWQQVGRTAADGRFTIWGVTAAGMTLRVARGKQTSEPVRAAARARDVTITFDPGIDFVVRAESWPWPRQSHATLSYLALDAAGERLDGSNWGSPGISTGNEAFVGRARDATWTFFWHGLPDGKIGWLSGVRPTQGETLKIPIFDSAELAGRVEIPEGVSHEELLVRVRVALSARDARPAADGTFRVDGLPPARLEVYVLRRVPGRKRLKGPATFARPGENPVLAVPTPK